MGRYMGLVALLLNPALVLGGLAKVEEVPLTPEEVARVSSLKKVTKVSKVEEAAILVKGDQGRPCILKPDLEGGWTKLCAVFWQPGGQIDQTRHTLEEVFFPPRRQNFCEFLYQVKRSWLRQWTQ